MANLCSLPIELLLLIFGYLSDDRQSLSQLCRVSRRNQGPATEELYKDIKVDGYFYSRFSYLTRTLLECPELANLVVNLTFHVDCEFEDRYAPMDRIGQAIIEVVKMGVPAQVVGHVASNLKEGKKTGFGAILFALLPSLQTLNIEVVDTYHEGYVNYALVEVLYGISSTDYREPGMHILRSTLNNIRTLVIPIPHYELLRFFLLPQLKALHLNLIDNYDINYPSSHNAATISEVVSRTGIRELTLDSDWSEIQIANTNTWTECIFNALQKSGELELARASIDKFVFRLSDGINYDGSSAMSFNKLVSSMELSWLTLNTCAWSSKDHHQSDMNSGDFSCPLV